MSYVLLMVFSVMQGGVGVVQQEFTSFSACEKARIAMQKAHTTAVEERYNVILRAQVCFEKGEKK
jgi:hypothetical protein